MIGCRIIGFVALLLVALAQPIETAAQFTTPSSGSTTGSSGGSGGVTTQSAAKTSFDDIDVQVRRVVRDPSQDGMLRLILSVTDNGKEARKVAFLTPPTVLIDDLGNVYYAVASSGIQICANSKLWDLDLAGCHRYQPDDTTRLSNGVPTNVVLTFSPAQEGFSAELATLAQVGSIQSRIAYYTLDGKSANYADIILNDITIPQGGN